MTKKISLTLIATIIFVAVVVVLEVIHRQSDSVTTDVPTEYLQPIDTALPTEFIQELEQRAGNALGPDLGY